MKMTLRPILGLVLAFLVLTACGKSKKEANLEKVLASYVQNSDETLVFGSIDAISILTKADYKQIPKFGLIVDDFLKDLAPSLDLEVGIYFAINGGGKDDVNPDVVAFVAVKDADSLRVNVMRKGYDLEQLEDFEFAVDGDLNFALHDEVFIVLVQGNHDLAAAKLIDIVAKTKKAPLDDKVLKYCSRKGDIQFAIQPGRFTRNLPFGTIDEATKKRMNKMQEGSIGSVSVFFEEGRMRTEYTGELNEEFLKWNYFLKDSNASIRKKMGDTEPNVALATNIDTRLLQEYIETMAGKSLMEILKDNGNDVEEIKLLTGGKLGNVWTGQLGATVQVPIGAFGGIPDMFGYAGLGPRGKSTLSLMMPFLINQNQLNVSVNDKELRVNTKETFKEGEMQVPEGCESFGKHGLTMFVNLKEVDLSSFDLEGPAKLAMLVSYLNLWQDLETGEMVLQLKNEKHNFLKQVVDLLVQEFEDRISGMQVM
jgi:hypothetical protein